MTDAQRHRILVCDDEAVARRAIVRALGKTAYDFVECDDGSGVLNLLGRNEDGVDLVLLDLHMPGLDGLSTLRRIVELSAPPPVVVVTADTSVRAAVDAVKTGAADYLCKPYAVDELRIVVEKTIETGRLRLENRRLAAEVRRLGGHGDLLGESPAIRTVLDAIDRVAPTAAGVLVVGESGTGKELVARRIHALSPRRRKPFITVNCAAIPESLVESELFGHRRGAFTGADRDRAGKFQDADGGTLFLDEIGDMARSAQSKLLRVLQEGVVEVLGGGTPVEVDIRIVAATHRELESLVETGAFREDLLFRLRVVEVPLPPLRERGMDILILASHFLDTASGGAHRFSLECERALLEHTWPGNVRELANAIERAVIFSRDNIIHPEDLPASVGGGRVEPAGEINEPAGGFQTAKKRVIEQFERSIITKALEDHHGNISRAASTLGIHRQNLQQKMKSLGIEASEFRSL